MPETAPPAGRGAALAVAGAALLALCCVGTAWPSASASRDSPPVVIDSDGRVLGRIDARSLDGASCAASWTPALADPALQRGTTMTEIPSIADRLDAAGLPADNLLRRRAALPGPVQQLHHDILEVIATTGTPPTSAQLTSWATELGLELTPVLRALADAELLFTGAEATAVTGGVPFAAYNTSAHRVQISGGPTVAANCAVHALGIPAMLGRDAEIHSTDPHSGEPVVATSREGTWRWQPEKAVVFIGSSGSGRPTESCCPVINFFTDADNARAYRRQHHLDGDVLTMPGAAAAGALVFGGLFSPSETA
ncbi:organomercurial lyase [Geodermatophilus sp. URMC 62]|uniref:organomercurial lyase n=1 Tax=Geodermatophilus sp. URMC 62 TaxID=3423414 RepID=UPI00406CA019